MRWDYDAVAQDLARESPKCRGARGSVLGASRLEAGEHLPLRQKIPDTRMRSFPRPFLIACEECLERPNTSHYFTLSAQAVLPGR